MIYLSQESGKMKTNMALIEVPELKVTYDVNGRKEVYCAVRTDYPKQSQLIVAGILRHLGNVAIVDMKLGESEREEFFKEFQYGKGTIKCYRKGAGFESAGAAIKASDILVLTSNFTRSSGIVVDFIKYAKSVNPRIKIIVGGSDATPRPEHYLKNGADIVVLGEGEYILPRLVQAVTKNRPLEGITGIAYGQNGSVRHNSRNPATDRVNVDDIPLPALDLVERHLENYVEAFEGPLPENVKTPIGILETSRGCMEACSFCTTPHLRKDYRFMSTGRIKEWLGHFKKFGIETLVLMEDNLLSRLRFPDGRKKVMELFNLLRDCGFAWEFGNGLEIGKFMSEGRIDHELIDKMFYHDVRDGQYLGCYRLYTPLESLHQEPDKVHKKLRPYDQELGILEAIAATQIPMMTFGIIIGRPDDTDETLKLTEKRCLEIKRLVEARGVDAYFTPYLNTLFPGTADYEKYRTLLKYDIENFPELYHFHTAGMQTENFAPERLTILKRELEERINGPEARRFWGSTGKYYFKRHGWNMPAR